LEDFSVAVAPTSDIRKAAPGPHPGAVAVVSAVLFVISLVVLGSPAAGTRFPRPSDAPSAMQAYFLANAAHAQLCAFFQFGAALTLGIFTAAATNRLQSLGVRVTGVRIALFGGWLAAFNSLLVAALIWVLAQPGVAQNASAVHTVYLFAFALGGVGYAAALGLLCAGLSVPALASGLLPRWLAICGLVLAVIGELSWFGLIAPPFDICIPLTRFPGYLWIIAAGFALPRTRSLSPTAGESLRA
jgi:hypothetical protein